MQLFERTHAIWIIQAVCIFGSCQVHKLCLYCNGGTSINNGDTSKASVCDRVYDTYFRCVYVTQSMCVIHISCPCISAMYYQCTGGALESELYALGCATYTKGTSVVYWSVEYSLSGDLRYTCCTRSLLKGTVEHQECSYGVLWAHVSCMHTGFIHEVVIDSVRVLYHYSEEASIDSSHGLKLCRQISSSATRKPIRWRLLSKGHFLNCVLTLLNRWRIVRYVVVFTT